MAPTLLVPLTFWFLPLHLDPKAQHAMAISLFMILGWATEVMDHGLTGLIGCYLFWALNIVTFDVAFSGFANDTPWFLMGAILFGSMASKSGLAKRLAYLVTLRIGTSYPRLLLALIVSDFLLTFLVPSGMARVAIMAAVAAGLIGAFGLGVHSNVGRGMFLVLTYTAGVFDKTIIAGAAVYQSGVVVIGYSYGYFRAKDILRLGLIMSVVDSLLLLIIVPFYWPLIGIR